MLEGVQRARDGIIESHGPTVHSPGLEHGFVDLDGQRLERAIVKVAFSGLQDRAGGFQQLLGRTYQSSGCFSIATARGK